MTDNLKGVSDDVLAMINAAGEQRRIESLSPATEIVEEKTPSTETKVGRKPKYPWDLWFNGRTHEVERGRDFTIAFSTFQSMLHTQVGKRDLVIATMTVSPGVLRFQACADKEAADAIKQEWRSAWYDDGYGDAEPETE